MEPPRIPGRFISLRLADPDLYEHAVQLVGLRNRVVHEGATVEFSDALRAVVAARQAFEWLDGIEPGGDDEVESEVRR